MGILIYNEILGLENRKPIDGRWKNFYSKME